MIPFNTPIGNFEIPSSFEDITVEDLLYFRECIGEPLKIMERITGLKSEELTILDLDPLAPHLDFLKDNLFEELEPSRQICIDGREVVLPEDISDETWGQKLLSNQAIRNGSPLEALAIYLQPIWDECKFDADKVPAIMEIIQKEKVAPVYSSLIYIINGLKEIAEKESKMLKPEVTFEQKAAGIAMFNELGDFNSILMIAEKFHILPKQALEIEYSTIFLTLLHIKISAKFDKRYQEIINKRRK